MQAERTDDSKAGKRSRGRAPASTAPRTPQRARYTTADKIRACTAMLSTNIDHPYSMPAIDAAKQVLNAPQLSNETLAKWMNEYREQVVELMAQQPSMAAIVQDTQNKVLEMWTTARDKALERLGRDEVLDKAAARDLAVIGGITQDHIHKMHKVSPERMNKVYAIIDACSRVNLDADVLLDDMLHAVQSQAIAQQKTINVKAEDSTDVS